MWHAGGLFSPSTKASLVQREVARRMPCRRDCVSNIADLYSSKMIAGQSPTRFAGAPFAQGGLLGFMQICKSKYHIDSGNDNNQRKNILQNPSIDFIRKICAYNAADNRSRHKPQKQIHVQTSTTAVADCRHHT